MAKCVVSQMDKADSSNPEACIEVRVWGMAGREDQAFMTISGFSSSAKYHPWIEVIYSLQGAPLFYTRNFLQVEDYKGLFSYNLEEFLAGRAKACEFGEYLPATRISVTCDTGQPEQGDPETASVTDRGDESPRDGRGDLKIEIDIGAILGNGIVGSDMTVLEFGGLHINELRKFVCELQDELHNAWLGKHPDPAQFPPGSSNWSFVRQLNRQAYDAVAETFHDNYFANHLVNSAFVQWMDQLQPGGHILDVGCGHGDPVITCLHDNGFQVTGCDISPAMLARARQRFPQQTFWEIGVTELEVESMFDGACSFSSMLFLDPIDLFHGIYRLHRALKTGGLLFLYSWELTPRWRGEPFHKELGQWMWSWTYSLEEAVTALEEHGRFKVLRAEKVMTEELRSKILKRMKPTPQNQIDSIKQEREGSKTEVRPPESSTKLCDSELELPYPYIIIAEKVG